METENGEVYYINECKGYTSETVYLRQHIIG